MTSSVSHQELCEAKAKFAEVKAKFVGASVVLINARSTANSFVFHLAVWCWGSHDDLMRCGNNAADMAGVKACKKTFQQALGAQTRPKEYLKWRVVKRYFLYLHPFL